MAKEQGGDNRDKENRRKRRFWDFAQFAAGLWVRRKFSYSFAEFEPAAIDGPVLVVINHASAYDPLFVGAAFRNKPLTFIASEHILRSKWGRLLDRYASIIPHQKGARGSRTALIALKRLRRGESVFLAAEGEQTWDGRPGRVMPYTGKLVKGSGATLVTYLIEGAYLSAPRWALNTRRGKVYGRPAGVYGPEVLKEMSDEEVEALIERDLAFDIWEWQKTRPGGPVIYKCKKDGFAEGLERSVFTCPSCGQIGTLSSHRDSISCSCGFRTRMLSTGFFEKGSPFETVADWEEFDKNTVGTVPAVPIFPQFRSGTAGTVPGVPIFCDDNIELRRIMDGHRDEEAARGRLTLDREGDRYILRIGEVSFDLQNISNMTMVLADRVVFSDKSGYYELLSEKKSRTNLRKYVIAREMLIKE